MPTYQAPRSDEARLSVLDKTATVAPGDIAATRPSITSATLAAVTPFLALFRPLYQAVASALSGREKEVREREAARVALDTYVRDFWEVLKRRAHRLKQPAEILAFYGLPLDGNIPDITTFAQLVNWADKIIQGETDAVAAGYPAMANPSAAEIVPILANARVQDADVPPADRTHDDTQAAVAAQRATADLLIEDIRADLLSSLRRLDAPSQRRVMRNYGLTFVSLPGEPADPGETTPPAEPPPA
ncbi:MAG TPA: hypothetical protein VGL24_04785 [Chthoniobacterales bacterium]